jgi:type II secretory pathway component PulC
VASAGPVPELLGVVGAPGKAGSAIFQMGGSSSNVGVGESIGSSGWRLRSAEGDSVLIERSGVVRRISIGSGT